MLQTLFYYITIWSFYFFFLIYNRVRVRGKSELKKFLREHKAPVILAANHESYLDPPIIAATYPGRLRYIAWEDLFRRRFLGFLIKNLGAVPVSHENRSSAATLLRQVIGFIENGQSVLIFPEGQRTLDGKLQPLEGGVALLAAKTGAPIVPVWLEGPYESLPPGKGFPKPVKISVTYGEPIKITDLPNDMNEKDRRAEILKRLSGAFDKMAEDAAEDIKH